MVACSATAILMSQKGQRTSRSKCNYKRATANGLPSVMHNSSELLFVAKELNKLLKI